MKSPERVQRAQNKTMLPAEPGTYVLVLRSSSTRATRIGRLGTLMLRPGYYLYVGSAFGPVDCGRGLRITRAGPQRPTGDYLGRYTRLESMRYCCGERREHGLAAAIGALPGAIKPMRGFGRLGLRMRDASVLVRGVAEGAGAEGAAKGICGGLD